MLRHGYLDTIDVKINEFPKIQSMLAHTTPGLQKETKAKFQEK